MEELGLKDRLLDEIRTLKQKVDHKAAKSLNLDFTERVGLRLASFSEDCAECRDQLFQLVSALENLNQYELPLDRQVIQGYHLTLKKAAAHLEKTHKLVAEAYYTGIYLSLGMSIGMVFGMTLFDNLAIGMSLGLCVGLAVGAGLDAKAKKDGLVI